MAIQKSKHEVLDKLLQSAKEILDQYSSLAEISTTVLVKTESWAKSEVVEPKELLDIFRRIHDMQMHALNTINSTLERFPVEHSIQELQLLELYRKLTEHQKQSFILTLEQTIKGR